MQEVAREAGVKRCGTTSMPEWLIEMLPSGWMVTSAI